MADVRTSGLQFLPGAAKGCLTRTTPGSNVKRAPLGQTLLIDVPLPLVDLDLVAPTELRQHEENTFFLTLMNYGTNYPKTIVLPDKDSVIVMKVAVKNFSLKGLSQKILSDGE